jgi:hypothetical protein
MPMQKFLLSFLILIISNLVIAQDNNSYDLHGFNVNFSLLTEAQKKAIYPSYLSQVKIIEAVELPNEMLAMMKTIPVVADPSFSAPGTSALFSGAKSLPKGEVRTNLKPMPNNRPILLHEMLHAYDWNAWHFKNEIVNGAYQRAISEDLYPDSRGSHFLANAREFFAISGTIYLFGTIQQAPYNCDILAKTQERYLRFMEKLYGKHTNCE